MFEFFAISIYGCAGFIGIYFYLKVSRFERATNKFNKFKAKVKRDCIETRKKQIYDAQQKIMEELAEITLKRLEYFQNDIPQPIFDELKAKISIYIDTLDCDKLYNLYNLLKISCGKSVNRNLTNFRR